jgi:hypothetical protein
MFGFGHLREAATRPEPERATEPVIPLQPLGQSDEDYRQVLIDKIAGIDKTKRDIKAQIHSNAIRAKAEKVSVDQVWLRRAKDKMDHLTREREEIRKALHTVNEGIKDKRRAEHRPGGRRVAEAFLGVAKERLPPALYDEIMDEAAGRIVQEVPESENENGSGVEA